MDAVAGAPTLSRAEIIEKAGIDPVEHPQWATLARLLADRYSCRAYQDRAVPEEVIRELLSVTQMSASWCNSQPWQVHVTRGAGTERFREAVTQYAMANPGARQTDFPFPKGYEGVYDERRRVCGWQLYESVGIAKGDREASRLQALQNFRLFGAPHVAIVTTEAVLGVYGAIDCGIFVGNFLLAAQSRGLGTIAQASLAMVGPFVREFFDLPDSRSIICGISFGYPDPDSPANSFRTNRAAVDDVVHWIDE
jgi:nitroreductase